jgi:hypothetical protein
MVFPGLKHVVDGDRKKELGTHYSDDPFLKIMLVSESKE